MFRSVRMADTAESDIGIFDDFGDAAEMETTYCRQVSEDQYQEEIRSETDKALGELCNYLDKNPDVYARILRKRKQEEMERSGVISFMKSKVMSLIHGEDYQQCLVSTSDCDHQTNALKTGICKTFQLSQEVKGNTTRHSARLAAKRQAQMTNNSDIDSQAPSSSEDCSQIKSNSVQDSQKNGESSSQPVPDYSSESPAVLVATVIPGVKSPTQRNLPKAGSLDSDVLGLGNSNLDTDITIMDKQSTIGTRTTLTGHPPPPPPPPPLPPSMLISTVSKTSLSQSALTSITNTPAKKARHSLTKCNAYDTNCPRQSRTSPRKTLASRENSMNRSASAQNLSFVSRPDSAASMDGPFLTPMVPPKLKSHKRTLDNVAACYILRSNSSVDSTSSCGSFNSIHSELMSSNPVTRLRSTAMVRSPGGTPVRSKSDVVPTEPLHKALFMAMRSKFKNVKTPSPASARTSLNSSKASVHDSTFSP